jgi:hypothetical protein
MHNSTVEMATVTSMTGDYGTVLFMTVSITLLLLFVWQCLKNIKKTAMVDASVGTDSDTVDASVGTDSDVEPTTPLETNTAPPVSVSNTVGTATKPTPTTMSVNTEFGCYTRWSSSSYSSSPPSSSVVTDQVHLETATTELTARHERQYDAILKMMNGKAPIDSALDSDTMRVILDIVKEDKQRVATSDAYTDPKTLELIDQLVKKDEQMAFARKFISARVFI